MERHVEKTVVYLLLFLLPTQLALHFWPAWSFVFGIRIDFLAPALYLTDILVLGLLGSAFMTNRRKFVKTFFHNKIFQALLVLAVLNSIFSTSLFVSLYRWLKIVECLFVALYFAKISALDLKTISKTLLYSSVLFSLIGILQFMKSGTIGGLLYWLGERSFNSTTPGIALVSLNGVEHLRAYSTFAHPNSLAGFLGAVLIFCLLSGTIKKSVINIFAVLVISICFLLTFSVSAYFGLLVVLFFFLVSKNKIYFKSGISLFLLIAITFSLVLPLASPWVLRTLTLVSSNISQRLDLAYIAGNMVSRRFWTGEGLGTFIINIPFYKGTLSYSWLLQPVHNIFLLVFSEAGLIGILVFAFMLYKLLQATVIKSRYFLVLAFVFLIFTGLFDHYTLTLQQNLLLFSLLSGLALS